MTTEQRIKDFILAVGTDYKATRAMIGTLASLSTTEKGSLVGAVNEVRSLAQSDAGGGVAINDTSASGTTTYSSNKIEALRTIINDTVASLSQVYSSTKVDAQIAALIDDASSLTTKTFSASKTNSLVNAKPSINDTTASATSVYSANKVNAVVAALINDAVTATGTAWSSTKVQSVVNAAVASLVASSPTTLDTLNELATALGNDPAFSTTITTALGNRVRFDAAQTLTAAQKAQAKANIDAYGNLEIGNPDADFVAAYTAAKA